MYLEYWKLRKFPFENVPDPEFMFYSTEHQEALIRMSYAVQRMKGAALLTGEVGSGKTTLSRVFIQQLADEEYDIGLITNPALTPLDFLKEIVYQIGLDISSNSKADLLETLNRLLIDNLRNNKNTLLIIDEAQLISSDTFEEIRLILNYQLNDRFLLTILLIGQPELKNMIRQYKQLDQRIAIRYHLNPLNDQEAVNYILYRLDKAGVKESIFTTEALESIYHFSEGIPRIINNICDLSLLIGFSLKVKEIDEQIIKKVAKDSL
jgi:general secretion pathway protein A